VISGRFELGLGYELAPDSRLATSRVFTLPPYVLLPAGHRLAGRSKVTLAQLAGEPLALLDLPQSRDYFLGMFAAAGVRPDIRYRSSSVETVRALPGGRLTESVPAGQLAAGCRPVVTWAGT
jgi:DNA-binding transcriptional LysR family regulator